MPEMRFVHSTSLEASGYDPVTRELFVRFLKSGLTYVYIDVDESVFDEFFRADSKGSYYNRQIKPAYQYRQL